MKYIAEYTNPYNEELEAVDTDNKETCPLCSEPLIHHRDNLYFCNNCMIEFEIYEAIQNIKEEFIMVSIEDLKKIGNLSRMLWENGDSNYVTNIYNVLEKYNVIPDEDGYF